MSHVEEAHRSDEARYWRGILGNVREIAAKVADNADLSEDGLALAFAERYTGRLRFCHTTGCWFAWTDTHWRRDETQLAFCWARDLVRELNLLDKTTLKKITTAAAVERAARADRKLATTFDSWNRDPMLLGTPGGVVDLRTGELRPAKPEDGITKVTAVAPGDSAEPELFLHFLEQVTRGDFKLIRFLQQIAGYALTADVREHALFFVHGDGGNGKGVFVRTIKAIMGDYAITAPMDVFTEARGERHPTELAMLHGARLVTAEETEQGRAWAQARIKTLTGGDAVTARYMRRDFFTFAPTWKLLLVGNHQPILRNVDVATRRRFNVVPFTFKPETPDMTLEERLRAEYPAILRWMLEGTLDWLANGLTRPDVVAAATSSYFELQDLLGQWLDEACEQDTKFADTNKALFASWAKFADDNGIPSGKSQTLSDELSRLGFQRIKDEDGIRGRGFRGIRAKPVTALP
jgi:putative DNA primase/helicase